MPLHSVIASFVDQGSDTITASVLSCLASSLNEPGVAQALIERHRPVCKDVMSRLVAVANDNGKNPNARIMALECLYALSHVPNSEFRCGDLLDAVQKLNESFEEFLETQATTAVDQQHEMLTVLLFRCSGYTGLKAGDLLQQLYSGDDTRLVFTLQTIIQNRSLEWEIVHASVRCMYELTTPVSYFAAPDEDHPVETTKITAFQDKITVLLIHLSQRTALRDLFNELSARWALAMADGQLAPILEGQAPVTPAVRDGPAMNFLVVFRYVAAMLLNVADFCERMELVRSYQESFIVQHQSFLGGTLIPFVRLALRCWESTKDTTHESQNNLFMNVAIAAMRLLRFALYRVSQELQQPLAAALAALARHVQALEPQLCTEYVGMLVLVLAVEALCNANAANVPAIAPDFTALVAQISTDKNPLRPGAQFTAAQAFTYCLANETSTYCTPDNESVALLRQKLHDEDAETINEATMAIQALEEQLGMLQSLMMELALGQLLGDLCLLVPFGAAPDGSGGTTAPPHAAKVGSAHEDANEQVQKQKKTKKTKHPANYVCMLTKKLMREPVVLRNGHHFELDALQEVVDRVGHVDPLTGEAFQDELQVDMNLQQEIARYRVEMAARGKTEA
ncbi:hypothetical protein DQ04_02211040 [Trypanosoma grayi]|uniref:hypothetical protein n=1 Tax=Trypanosoma grayi TaxID=71804 RepID=UPI0004F4AB3C|nr:hypothetical protein DQ04_02211040 [Trypanosoma grayi]KEG11855.1 hypothetical protein DQ04_02211040 [Trypanosoma grayi]